MAKKIGGEAVNKSTGKTWDDWFAILNKTGAKKMGHRILPYFWLKLTSFHHGGRRWLQSSTNRILKAGKNMIQ